MASLECIYKHRYLVLLWSVLQILLFSAIQFGWPSLVVVLKQERFFYDLCEDVNKTTTTLEHCVKQDERLSLVFTVGSGSGPAVGLLLVVPFSDHFGPRKARLLCCLLFGLTFLFFVLADKDRPYMMFPGLSALSGAGLALLVTIFQVANIFDKWKSSVVSLFNGAVDSSAIIFLFCKLLYDAGVALRTIFIFYFMFAITLILLYTFILPPYTITMEHIEAMHKPAGNPVTSFENRVEHQEPSIKMEERDPNGTTTVNHTAGVNGKVKPVQKNCEPQQDEIDLQVLQLPPSFQLGHTNSLSSKDSSPRLLSLMSTAEYILLVLFLSVCNLRLLFYVGALNSYLEFMSDNNIDTVSHYTNWFGIVQLTGFIFAPLVGIVMDWKPKKKRNQKTDIGFIIAFLVTSFVALLLNILVLIPILSVQYVTFVVQVILRAFVYAVYSAFILHKFPMLHFGKLYGSGHLISSAFGCVQYGLFIVAEDTLEKDQFWVNIGLLVLCLFLNILPALLWFKERKEGQQAKIAENGIEVCNN